MSKAKLNKGEKIIQIDSKRDLDRVVTSEGRVLTIQRYAIHPKTGKNFDPNTKAAQKIKEWIWSDTCFLTEIIIEK